MDNLFLSNEEIVSFSRETAEKNLSLCYNNLKEITKVLERLFRDINPLYLLKRMKTESGNSVLLDKDDKMTILIRKTAPVLLQNIFVSSKETSYGKDNVVRWKDSDKIYKYTEKFVKELCFALDNHLSLLLKEGELKLENLQSYRNKIFSRFFDPILCPFSDDIFLSLRTLLSYKTSTFLSNSTLLDTLISIKKSTDDVSMLDSSFSSFDITSKSGIEDYVIEKGKGDFFSLLKNGKWEMEEKPFFSFNGKVYSFLTKESLYFIYQDSMKYYFDAVKKDLALLFDSEEDSIYTYKGNKIKVEILPSLLTSNSPREDEEIFSKKEKIFNNKERVLIISSDNTIKLIDKNIVLSLPSLTRACLDMQEKERLMFSLFGNDNHSRDEKVSSESYGKAFNNFLDNLVGDTQSFEEDEVLPIEEDSLSKTKEQPVYSSEKTLSALKDASDKINQLSSFLDNVISTNKEISVNDIPLSSEVSLKDEEEFDDDSFDPAEDSSENTNESVSDDNDNVNTWFEDEVDEDDTSNEDESIEEESSLLEVLENEYDGDKKDESETFASFKVENGELIKSICTKLSPKGKFSSFVSSSSPETLEMLEKALSTSVSKQRLSGNDKILNIDDFSISIILSEDNIRDDLRLSELMNNAGAVMYSRHEKKWDVVIIHINEKNILELVMEKEINEKSFSPSDWKRVLYISEKLK